MISQRAFCKLLFALLPKLYFNHWWTSDMHALNAKWKKYSPHFTQFTYKAWACVIHKKCSLLGQTQVINVQSSISRQMNKESMLHVDNHSAFQNECLFSINSQRSSIFDPWNEEIIELSKGMSDTCPIFWTKEIKISAANNHEWFKNKHYDSLLWWIRKVDASKNNFQLVRPITTLWLPISSSFT